MVPNFFVGGHTDLDTDVRTCGWGGFKCHRSHVTAVQSSAVLQYSAVVSPAVGWFNKNQNKIKTEEEKIIDGKDTPTKTHTQMDMATL